MSPEDPSTAPHSLFAPSGDGEFFALPPLPRRHRYWLHALLFFVTLLTTCIVGVALQQDFAANIPFDVEHSLDIWGYLWHSPSAIVQGLPFSVTLLLILLAHEFGHYGAAVFHQVDASLPYFLPSPFLGTFGAFIRVRSPIYSKRALFDIGIAGPLAGFVFLVPALAVGLAFSKVVPEITHQGTMQFGVPFLEWLLKRAIFPGFPPAEVYLHPVARAAWVGMFATAMNLLPIGQLDGGHIFYSFFPQRHKTASKLLCVLMLPLGKFWFGWFVWGLALLWLNRRHPSIYDPATLSPGRRKLGYLALAIFLLCFSIAPISGGGF